MSDNRPKIVPFVPKARDYYLQCPDCGGVLFSLRMMDLREDDGIAATSVICATDGCDYDLLTVMSMHADEDGEG